nr:cytochrome P450 [Roseococcus sp. SDR]
MTRRVGFDVLAGLLGIPAPAAGRLDVWSTRLFGETPTDPAGRAAVLATAAAFRAHLDAAIANRKSAGAAGDDVLGRCLAAQAEGRAGFSDIEIRTLLLCLMVGGPPQVPMVLSQALEQLLRRPGPLAEAQAAARADDDTRLHAIIREAMRFDPLAPALPRVALAPTVIAAGTPRARTIPAGAKVLVCFASAMMDERRVPDPARFNAGRRDVEYIHFGHGLHACIGRAISEATLHMTLKPLLRRPGLRRAPGAAGRLAKRGIVAERLVVAFD